GYNLNPPYFNLAEGSRISATATCGEDESGRPRYDLYCKLVGGPTIGVPTENIQGQYCSFCNSNDPNNAHPVSNAIDGTERWWQSPPLSRGLVHNEVNVTLDLGQLFHVAYILIKFANSPRPDLWVLERSVDHGRTFTPWQYFAHSRRECIEQFGKQPNARILHDDDQLCTTEYSRIVPLENGEIVVSLVNGRPGAQRFTYSPVLQDFTKATNIRLNFLRTNTLLGHLISKAQRDPTVTRRYYYSIKDISVGGRCVCHGHAQVCGGGSNQDRTNRLHCMCQHNTCGESCDRCCPGFNQKPWRSATVDSPNECQPCQCFSHASDCFYDPEVEKNRASLDTFGRYDGGGVCINCQHNTAGVNCERCIEGFYRPFGVPPESPSGCIPCRCDERTTAGCEMGSGRCICKPQFSGENCDRCADGYVYYPQCIRKLCLVAGIYFWCLLLVCLWALAGMVKSERRNLCINLTGISLISLSVGSMQPVPSQTLTVIDWISCIPNIHQIPRRTDCCHAGPSACPPGYFGSPSCRQCVCDYRGTVREVCDALGRCLCRQGVNGERCDRCQPGYHHFPNCQGCICDGAGVANSICSPDGQCVCLTNYRGQNCDDCAPGYYGYPDCATCQCSTEGSYGNICNSVSGQCLCLPGVVGQQCDQCASGLRFPQCSGSISRCNSAGTEIFDPQTFQGSCRCLENVEGTLCDRCKPLYWNLAVVNPQGCKECQCDVKGTLSGVGDCQQKSGQCHCKPYVSGLSCDTCKDGYFQLQKKKYFGCQDCQCDLGGAVDMSCDGTSGQCRCRDHVVGRQCREPAPNFYFPTLHQLKFEIEDGVTPNSRAVRFGFNQREFPGFSWRGYAVMSPAQPEVILTLPLGFPGPFHIVIRYSTPRQKGDVRVRARILLVDEAAFQSCCNWSDQSKEVIFPESPSPTFLTVPGEGFAEPFELTPGKWIIYLRAEGILLDYLVLLPQDYYEAPMLREKITQPCTYLPTASRDGFSCLLYKHVPLDGFSSSLGSHGTLSSRNKRRRRRQAHVRRPTPDHPEMAVLSGRQSNLQLNLRVAHPGPYVLILEYASEVDAVQNLNMLISEQSGDYVPARANIYSCTYSFFCRSVALDGSNRASVLQLSHKTEVLMQTSTTLLLLYKVYAIPAEEFSLDYVDPKVLCVSTHGRFTEDSRHCIQSQFDKPASARVLYASRDGRLSSGTSASLQRQENVDWRRRRQTVVPVPQSDGVLLKFPQTEITLTPQEPLRGRYVPLVHYHQPEHASFPVDVRVSAGREWKGSMNATFCPAVSGCRKAVFSDGEVALDFDGNSWQQPVVSVTVPPNKTLVLDYILLVPDSTSTPNLLNEKLIDRSADFIQKCRGEGFHIDPKTASQFCRESARALAAAYNDGALPCNCDRSGSTGSTCDPAGGQCTCRQHVIGRQCTKCATGYYGFPYCRPCECGRRLCDEVTGKCICPPQTVKPSCEVCQAQTFSYHPLLGCDGCECSPTGIRDVTRPDCDRLTGQCSCKPRIGGRQCDRCAPGYYRFPECIPCNCNRDGVTPEVCHPDTGRCLCKKNVAGVECDACKDGSFYFDPSNPHGCTSCFCFGATNRCQSSSKRRGKFVDMAGWRLESLDQEVVASVLNPASDTVVADVQELSPTVQTLHWVAPSSYLGNKVSSYGGFLTYQSKSFGIPSEGMTLMDRRPDVVLTGQGMTLIHMAPQVPLPDRLYQGRVQLLEGNWRHGINNKPVSREELMMVLADLAGLRIHALYFTQTQRLGLGEVGLEETSLGGTGGPGNTVEQCSCPPQYTGDSCERCSPGYYRDDSAPFPSRCVPCECNGHAEECEDKTGRCLNCRYNTAGDRCERCKEGYYGYATRGTCRVCPCPFSVPTNSFAVGCREVFGDFQCVCREGYTGNKCQSCAPGYYGDPLVAGGRCQACRCSGNGNSCDSRTGVCKNTLEPGDTDTDGQCQGEPTKNRTSSVEIARPVPECDNCAQTLLQDLEKLDEELERIKTQLGNATASASSQDKLRKLEKNVADIKSLVSKFSSAVNNQKPRVDQLDEDTDNLLKDMNTLNEKVQDRAADADRAVTEADKTHKRAKDLYSEVEKLRKKIQDLLQKLKEAGTTLPSKDLEKMLRDAKRMVREMENRNFTPQKTAAEKEKDEAKKLLEYIKANVSRQYDENNDTAEKLQDLLKAYEAKLKDLDQALKDAEDLVKKANVQNGLNGQTLGNLQKQATELKKERDMVKGQMDMARNELKKTQDLLKMLTDSKTEYEYLAAQLDGAKNEVTKKVNELSKAASKEDIVEAAEKHAQDLAKMAKELEDAVKNASGRTEVRNARDAIDAYKNITDAINAAAAAANEAKTAADRALNSVNSQRLTERAKNLKDNSEDLLTEAERTDKDLTKATSDLRNLNLRLIDADSKKKALQKNLLDAQNQLRNIRDMINEAKRKSASANKTASETMDKVSAIKEEISKIGVSPSDGNLNNVLTDVNQTINNLLQSIPTLNDKISEVKNLTSQFSQINNITGNIKKIKELIEQARDAANRIAIPMKFSGTGHVELRPPTDLDDLKAYTAMSLSLQRPESRGDGARRRRQNPESADMFVLYLGSRNSSKNYIGMVVRNNVLYGVYKLNGQEYKIQTETIIRSPSEPAKFDRVDLNRIYQDAEITFTKDTSGTSPVSSKTNNIGDDSKNLLDLSPGDVVFYVGGYPANFTPPDSLNLPMYDGCIEFFSFNDKAISLYNFRARDKINLQTPCKSSRYVPPVTSNYYEGTGYSRVPIDKQSSILLIAMSLYTRSENGLIAYFSHEFFLFPTQNNYFAVTMEKGVVFIHSNLLESPVTSNLKLFPVGIIGDKVNGKMTVRVASKEAAVANVKYNFDEFTELYVGGIPEAMRERYPFVFLSVFPFKGCLQNLKINKGFQPPTEQVGVSKGCPVSSLVIRKAKFDLGSALSSDLQGFSLDNKVTVSLGFKSTQSRGLFLQDKQLANGMNLELQNGHVVLKFNDKMWRSNKQYDDDQWHYLTVTRSAGRTELLIDDEDRGQEESGTSINDTGSLLILGGNEFRGCVSNLYTRRPNSLYKAEDFSTFQSSGDVLLDVCAADSPAQLMRDRSAKKDVPMQDINEMSPCASPATVKHAYRMYGSVSSLSFSLPLQVLQPRPQISLDVRTRAAEGLLFFAATRGGRAHLALYMSKGRIRLSVGKEKEIFNREKYNDGKWHTVMFSLEKRLFRLVVDGIRAQDGQMVNAELAAMQHFLSPVYLGGAPEAFHKESKGLPKQSVPGCIRNFKMNGALMTNPTTNRGAGPCLAGPTQKGAYFAGNRAHVIVNDSFVLNSTFELLFSIRPQSPTGLLLHVGVFSESHYLSVYMLRGEVVAQANSGKGELKVTVKPKTSLCDGMFHKISVIKRKNVIQLHVDTVDSYKIGPPLPATTLTKSSLYVGGIPETLVQQPLPVRASFVGCIQDMSVNSEPVSFERPPAVFGPVNLKECPG
uniref:Laminin subunit alpha 3 n=1 Tax=Tetraodon nigroviridis TaxID=99883 RepID=H3DCP0_TETNG